MGTVYGCPFHTVSMVNLSLSCFLVNVKLLNNKIYKKRYLYNVPTRFITIKKVSGVKLDFSRESFVIIVSLPVYQTILWRVNRLMEKVRSQLMPIWEKDGS